MNLKAAYIFLSVQVLCILIGLTQNLYAQTTQVFNSDSHMNILGFNEFDLSDDHLEVVEEKLLCKDWCKGAIITKVDTIDIDFNFDLDKSLVYVNYRTNVFSVRESAIKSLLHDKKEYILSHKNQLEGFPLLEVIVSGDTPLYKQHKLKTKKADYNAVLNVGSKRVSYKKQYSYFTKCNDQFVELPSKTKKAIKTLKSACGLRDIPKGIKGLEAVFVFINSSI